MNVSLFFRTVLAGVGRYKLRSSLMAIAIAIGVMAMTAIEPMASGARASFLTYANHVYPTDVVVLASDRSLPGRYANELELDDVEAIRATVPEILDWDPMVRVGARDLRNAGRSTRVGIVGYSERAQSVRRRSVRSGEFFSRADVDRRARVALIGSTTAERLFGEAPPVGAELYIDDRAFEIKGVLQSFGVNPHGADLDQTVWVPYTTAMEELLKGDYISEVALEVADPGRTEAVAERASEVMRERHAIPEGYVDDFNVVTPVAVRAQLDRAFGTLDLLVGSIVGIFFAMAALVVLGAMLIGVRQRAAEIGLRRAFGARSNDLRAQIAIEVLVVAAIASVVGVFGAWLTLELSSPFLADRLGMTDAGFSVQVAAESVAIAMLTALIGALWPAMRAAGLDPVSVLK